MNTRHAELRAQQRGIPPLVDELLDRYGTEQHDGHGAVVLYFDRTSIRTMERELGHRPVASLLGQWDVPIKSAVQPTALPSLWGNATSGFIDHNNLLYLEAARLIIGTVVIPFESHHGRQSFRVRPGPRRFIPIHPKLGPGPQ